MRILLLVILFISGFISRPSFANDLQCAFYYTPYFINAVGIQSVLTHSDSEITHRQQNQTVFYTGKLELDGRMLLRVPEGLKNWNTLFNPYPDSGTTHGDPRNLLFILGPQLSSLFGYEIRVADSEKGLKGSVEMISPGVDLLTRMQTEVNKVLISQNKEPISFVSLNLGFVSSKQALELSLKAKDDFEFAFPFEDSSEMLTPHEESFHKNFILPRELLRRARNINETIMGFHHDLETMDAKFSTEFSKVVVDSRFLEMDIGSAMLTEYMASQGKTKLGNKLDFETRNNNYLIEQMSEQIDSWFHPTLTAFEVLVQKLILYDPSFRVFLKRNEPRWVENLETSTVQLSHYSDSIEPTISPGNEAHRELFRKLKDYEIVHRKNLKPSLQSRKTPMQWAEYIVRNHNIRISEITEAMLIVLKNKK